MSEIQTKREFDVAFSFADTQREYVERVKNELLKYKVSVFYDEDNTVMLWGKNLYSYLAEIYSEKARFCVIFISKEYKEHPWTNHEFQFASERVLTNYGNSDMQEYILPVIFDDTQMPGLLTSIGYIDARKNSPEELAKYIALKVGKCNMNNDTGQNTQSLFEHIKLYIENYANKNRDIQVLNENSIISVSYNLLDTSRNIITFQLFEKYINLYIGEFLLGINPSAIVFTDTNRTSQGIKLINFSIFFNRSPEQDLSLQDFDNFLDTIISTRPEAII